MPTINGEKYACISCVRGHRVSTCFHEDRELKLIPPKGRPVKQCDHCRTARKSKSHHGKCHCGSKKEKKEQADLSDANPECCCRTGESCRCSTRSEAVELRMERSLKRPTVPVKSKPAFTTSQSDDKLLHVVNGHHKPCHRNNNAAHTSGQPYTIPRPHSHHGQTRAKSLSAGELTSSAAIESTTQDDYVLAEGGEDTVADEIVSYDFDKHFSSAASTVATATALDKISEYAQPFEPDWKQSQSFTDAADQSALSIDTSPNFTQDTGYQLFSPADLPLISPQAVNFNQTISHSSDFTNESAWTVDNYMMDGQIAVQDDWPSINNALLDDALHGSGYSDMASFPGATSVFASVNSMYMQPSSQSATKSGAVNNSMIIPADPDSPGDRPVDDWWPQNSFTSQDPATSSRLIQSSGQTTGATPTQTLDTANHNANYDWLY